MSSHNNPHDLVPVYIQIQSAERQTAFLNHKDLEDILEQNLE